MDPLNNDTTNPSPVTDGASNDGTSLPVAVDTSAATPMPVAEPAPIDGGMPTVDPLPMPEIPADPSSEMPAPVADPLEASIPVSTQMPESSAPTDLPNTSAPLDETTVASSDENMPSGSF